MVLEKKIFENGGRSDDGPWLYYKLTNEPKGSGELKMMAIYPMVHLVDSKLSAKFDEIQLMLLQNMLSKYQNITDGRTIGKTDGQV